MNRREMIAGCAAALTAAGFGGALQLFDAVPQNAFLILRYDGDLGPKRYANLLESARSISAAISVPVVILPKNIVAEVSASGDLVPIKSTVDTVEF